MLVPSVLACPLTLALSPILLAGKRYLVLAFSFAGKQNGGEGTYYSATSDFANESVPHSICVTQRAPQTPRELVGRFALPEYRYKKSNALY